MDYATVAFEAETGDAGIPLWEAVHPNGFVAFALQASPNGAFLYVSGLGSGFGTGLDYVTVAYVAALGIPVWTARLDGTAQFHDHVADLAVSPDGSRVFVTGDALDCQGSFCEDWNINVATVAYDALLGRELWVARYDGPAQSHDYAYDMEVDPMGRRVYVTGPSIGLAGE